MGRAEEIERLEEVIKSLDVSIKKRENSSHPEKYVNCLAGDRYMLAKHRIALAELKGSH
jgi:hypothetical protein